MRARLLSVAVAVLCLVTPLHAKRRAASVLADTPYLRGARETAEWLMSIERRFAPDGIAWPAADYQPNSFSAGMVTGASGTGTFFLRLYQITRDTRYLDRARGAANYVAAAHSNPAMLSHEWLGGVAGTGSFLLEVWRETNEQRYLTAARNGGDWVLQSAINDNGGIYWKHAGVTNTYTGLAHGAAGTGIYLLNLHAATNDAKYLDAAKKTWTWLSRYTVPLGDDGIGWKRLTHDGVTYPGWCGGSTGILYFLDKLAKATNDPEHTLALTKTALGFVNSALPKSNGGVAWDHYGPGTGNGVIYCHGATSVIGALANAYTITHDERLRDTARKAALWLDNIAITEPAGITWSHFDRSRLRQTGYMIGTASVGHAYLRLWTIDPSVEYLDQAKAAAAYLLNIADHPASGQTRWINYTHTPGQGDDPKGYETGWYNGAAGIGLFLLELHEATRGIAPPLEFSAAHP